MKYPKTGTIQIVTASEVEALTRKGWALLEILPESNPCMTFDQTVAGASMALMSVQKTVVTRTHRYVMHLEQGSPAERVVELEERLAALEKQAGTAETARAQQAKQIDEQAATIERMSDLYRKQTEELRVARLERSEYGESRALHLADLSRTIKALGATRLSQILGREVVDPDPVPEEQIKGTYQRLLEEEDDDENTTAG